MVTVGTYSMGLVIAASLVVTALELKSFPGHTPELLAEMDEHQRFHDRVVETKRMMNERKSFYDCVVAAQSRNTKKLSELKTAHSTLSLIHI